MAETVAVPPPVRHVVEQIAERFPPERIILFGSHAADTADEGSDVDLLVVMATAEPVVRQAAAISRRVDHKVPMDILVRTPEQVAVPDLRDFILRLILREGLTVYDARS